VIEVSFVSSRIEIVLKSAIVTLI